MNIWISGRRLTACDLFTVVWSATEIFNTNVLRPQKPIALYEYCSLSNRHCHSFHIAVTGLDCHVLNYSCCWLKLNDVWNTSTSLACVRAVDESASAVSVTEWQWNWDVEWNAVSWRRVNSWWCEMPFAGADH